MLSSRVFLEDVGLMEESYFLYFEELDWAMRAKKAFKLGYARESVVYHKEGASIGTHSNRANRIFFPPISFTQQGALHKAICAMGPPVGGGVSNPCGCLSSFFR